MGRRELCQSIHCLEKQAEKAGNCSVSLSWINVYACLVCGKSKVKKYEDCDLEVLEKLDEETKVAK